jgi:hypothetical protein
MTDVSELGKFTADDFAESQNCKNLGPQYFASRRVAERVLADFTPEMFEPVVKTLVDQIADQFWSTLRDNLLADTEYNVQGALWSQVEGTVCALLTGEPWALRRYVLAEGIDGQRVRRAIVEHCGAELRDKERRDEALEAERLAATYRLWRNGGHWVLRQMEKSQ